MEKNIFEHIGDKLNQYESLVDVEAEWDSIVEKQNKRKRKRGFFWITFLGSLLLAGVAYLLISPSPNPSQPMGNTPTEKSKAEVYEESASPTTLQKQQQITSEETEKEEIIPTFSPTTSTSVKQGSRSNQRLSNSLSAKPFLIEEDLTLKETADRRPSDQRAFQTKLSEFGPLPSLLLPISLDEALPEQSPVLKTTYSSPDLDLPASRPSLELFVHAGLAISRQKLTAKSIASEDYRTSRADSEQPLETYQYTAGINYYFNRRSYLSFGGHYNIGFDKIIHQYEVPKVYYFENVLLIRRTHSNGETEEVYGDTSIVGTQAIIDQQFNKYTSINLSISFGHYLLRRSRFGIALNGGLFQNISFQATGKIQSAAVDGGALVAIEGYKKSYGLGLLAGIDFDYKVSRSIVLSFRPSASYGLFSATKKSNVLNANFKQYGLSLGLKYRW